MAGCGLSFCHLQVSQECGPGGWISELLTPVRYFAGLWATELSKSLKHTSSKMSPGAWRLVLRLIWHLWLSKHWTSTCWGSAISQALSIAGDTCLKLTVPASHSTHLRKGKYWAVKWIKQRRPALIEVQMRSDPAFLSWQHILLPGLTPVFGLSCPSDRITGMYNHAWLLFKRRNIL